MVGSEEPPFNEHPSGSYSPPYLIYLHTLFNDLGDDIPSWVKWQMEACQCDWRMCNWATRINLQIPTIIMTAGIAMIWQVCLY